jgi:hypothetical protein
VDTARLRTLRTLPELQALLSSFLADRQLLPVQSELITREGELPEGLRGAIRRAENQDHAWRAWRHQSEVNAVSAQLDEDASRLHGRPVLLVFLHNALGQVIGSSKWLETRPGVWTHCPE